MAKVFEDYFSEIQTDMIAICLEYIEDRAEKIFIYCSYENKTISNGFFYRINGMILEKHEVNKGVRNGEPPYDVSHERQRGAMRIINQDIAQLIQVCKDFNRQMPTEIRIVYDVAKNSVNANYRYDPVYSLDPLKLDDHILEEWIEEEQRKLQSERSNQA